MTRDRLARCALCRRRCIPLADYEVPTCLRCDAAMEQLLMLVRVTPATRPRTEPQPRPVLPCGTHSAYNRHHRRGEPIDPLCQAAERVYRNDRNRARKARAA